MGKIIERLRKEYDADWSEGWRLFVCFILALILFVLGLTIVKGLF